MKATLKIKQTKLELEIETDDPAIEEGIRQIVNNGRESVEAAMAEAACQQLQRLIPGIKAICTGAWLEDDK